MRDVKTKDAKKGEKVSCFSGCFPRFKTSTSEQAEEIVGSSVDTTAATASKAHSTIYVMN